MGRDRVDAHLILRHTRANRRRPVVSPRAVRDNFVDYIFDTNIFCRILWICNGFARRRSTLARMMKRGWPVVCPGLPAGGGIIGTSGISWSGWGHAARVVTPGDRPELLAALKRLPGSWPSTGVIPRGLGRSYGDASLASGRVVAMDRLNRMLAFDEGLLTVEAGVALADIVSVWLPRGWFLPVTPGTLQVTVGGAVAADVHGKNHHEAGAFGSHVERLRLLMADGTLAEISPRSDPRLFWATVGGMGLTGIIVEASVRLRPVETGWMMVDYQATGDLGETMAWFQAKDGAYPYTVAWIDTNGGQAGRAIIMAGRHAVSGEPPARAEIFPRLPRARSVPFNLPAFAMNKTVGRLFNDAYYGVNRRIRRVWEPWWKFFYPLDRLSHWYRLYGRQGFVQYQAVFPDNVAFDAVREVFARLAASGLPGFLGVLKRLGQADPGVLSFPFPGYTLAVDVPVRGEATRTLFKELYALTGEAGGRIYLAKDLWLEADAFRAMYPRWREFRQIVREVDPAGRLASLQAVRLGLKG